MVLGSASRWREEHGVHSVVSVMRARGRGSGGKSLQGKGALSLFRVDRVGERRERVKARKEHSWVLLDAADGDVFFTKPLKSEEEKTPTLSLSLSLSPAPPLLVVQSADPCIINCAFSTGSIHLARKERCPFPSSTQRAKGSSLHLQNPMSTLDVAGLLSSLRRALEPQRKPDMLVSFGRWALVQRDSLAVRAASPLAVATVSSSIGTGPFRIFFSGDFENGVEQLTQPLSLLPLSLSLLFLSLPTLKQPGRARRGLRPGSALRVLRRLQAPREKKGDGADHGERRQAAALRRRRRRCRRRGDGQGLPPDPLLPREAACRRRLPSLPFFRRGRARRPPAPRGLQGQGARRGRGQRRPEGGRRPAGGSRRPRGEAGGEPEDEEGGGRRARGGVRPAADADPDQRSPEERTRRRRRRRRRRRERRSDGGVKVFREPAVGGAFVGRAGLEGRKGARRRMRQRDFYFDFQTRKTLFYPFFFFLLVLINCVCQLLQKKKRMKLEKTKKYSEEI